jgi:hypothetical protein
LSSIELTGSDGRVIYYVNESDSGLHFEIEYYKRPGVEEPDFEVTFDMTQDALEGVFEKYSIRGNSSLIEGMKTLSDLGYAEEFRKDILDGVFSIRNKFSWMSW